MLTQFIGRALRVHRSLSTWPRKEKDPSRRDDTSILTSKATSKTKCGLSSVAHSWFSRKDFHYGQQFLLESQDPPTRHQKSYSHTTELFSTLGLVLYSAYLYWPRLLLWNPEGLDTTSQPSCINSQTQSNPTKADLAQSHSCSSRSCIFRKWNA